MFEYKKLNRQPKYEVLTMKIANYKIIFKRYPSEFKKEKSKYFIDIWKRRKGETRFKKAGYTLQLLHKEYNEDDTFEYEFSSDGMWNCLDDYLRSSFEGKQKLFIERN